MRRGKCMVLRPKYRPLHTLGIYLRFGRFSVKILSAGELGKAGSIYGKLALVYQVQRALI